MHEIVGKPRIYEFKTPRNITIAGRTFSDITKRDKRQYMQGDEVHTVNYLHGNNVLHAVYNYNGKIEHYGAAYKEPEPMEFNGKKYNILFADTNEAGNIVYEQINPKTYARTLIETDKSGKVLNIEEPLGTKIAKGLKNFAAKIAKKIKP